MNFFAAMIDLPCRLIPTGQESVFEANGNEPN
jgi:hypothetical protein